jgi:hypothetical protein
MSYFINNFLPSRTRVFKNLYTKYPWMRKITSLILKKPIRFGVLYKNKNGKEEYTLEETPDGSITVSRGFKNLDNHLFNTSINLFIHVNEDYLKGWVESEEKLIKHPLLHITFYLLRTLPKVRLR